MIAKKSAKKASPKTKTNTRFAVIETGGKQYKVRVGDTIDIERIKERKGEHISFDKVLLVDDGASTQIGDPYLKGAVVEGAVEKEGKGRKIDIVRFKSKSRHLRRKGHRQAYLRVRISDIR